jgi:orotidine-5'-phosphate decarboxylase
MTIMQATDRLIVAIDRSSRDDILRLADALQGAAGMLKIGLQAFIANGPSIVREVMARGPKVFLDLKIHDIPNTARHAVAEAAVLGATMVTVHGSGGETMLRASVKAAEGSGLTLLGVTVLTSLDDAEVHQIGFPGTALETAVRLAKLAQESGLRGVVASPHDVAAIREACGSGMRIVVPGIRPEGSDAGDQRRTTTPAAAIAAGADYIVVGRPITDASDPRKAALTLVDALGWSGGAAASDAVEPRTRKQDVLA